MNYYSQQSPLDRYRPGSTILIDGFVDFCHISSFIEGEELARFNQNSKSRFRHNKPFFTMTLYHPSPNPMQKDPGMAADYLQNLGFFSRVSNTNKVEVSVNAPANVEKRRLPAVYHDLGQNRLKPFPLASGQELAKGTRVTMVLRIFSTSYGHNGVNLDAVIIKEANPRFLERKAENADAALAALGFEIVEDNL